MRLTPRSLARGAGTAAGLLAAAGAAAFAWGALVERRLFTLRRVDVRVLPPGAAPIRVLHLSDLHMAPWQRDKQAWVRGLLAEAPDLVVNTGDNLSHRDGIGGIEAALEGYSSRPGVYVNGSNDYYGPLRKSWFTYFGGPSTRDGRAAGRVADLDTPRLERFFTEDLGWSSLNNLATSVTVRGTRVELFGVNDPHVGFDRLDVLAGQVDDLDEAESADDDGDVNRVRVGVVHAPYRRVLNSFVTHGADLILAGHTHGGQVRVPGVGALVSNCDLPRDRARGMSVWRHALRSAHLHVSAGLGTSIYAPVRFACRPEATMLTLLPRG